MKIKIFEGNLIIKKGDKRDFSQLEKITGSLYVYSNVELPKLQTIGGSLCVRSNVEFKAPKLQTIGGSLYVYSNVEFKAPKVKFNVKNAREKALKFNFECFLKLGFLFADGILAKILEKKRNIYKIQIVGQTKVSFCIEVDGQFSHGDTIKQAKEDLKYKISNRDKSQYESWTLDKKITLKQAIEMYRVVTGACEMGTKHFVENVLTVKKKYYTIKEVIELTDGQYNNELLKEFFKNREGNRKCKI